VYDIDSIQFLQMVRTMRDENKLRRLHPDSGHLRHGQIF
jgi:hypothetical protein